LLAKKGCLIVFEGIEGSGKTTASRNLEKYLSMKDYKTMWTREPTTSKIGSLIENILTGQVMVAEEAIPLLFAADRADHTERIIQPAIDKGYIVISDRYIHSSLSYQRRGMQKSFPGEWLETINKYAMKPDLVFFLDIEPEEGLSRIGKWQRIHDDKFFEDLEAQKRIRQAYYEVLKLQKRSSSLLQRNLFNAPLSDNRGAITSSETKILLINASLSLQRIQNSINEEVQLFLKSRGIEKQPEKKSRGYETNLTQTFDRKNTDISSKEMD
jgi:dTMP kinase